MGAGVSRSARAPGRTRRQNWQIKRRELELIAARNFTLPRLDAVGLYRFRGFGDQLTGDGGRFASAMKDLGSGDHQEWRLGLELDVPIGFRQAWAGVRNAELQIAREKAILREQELAISHALGDAIAELARAHNAVKVNFNRLNAAAQRRNATVAAYRGDQVSLDVLLDAQQRLSNAQSVYFQSLAQHAKAIKNVHLEKGGLLQSNGHSVERRSMAATAYRDAAKLRRRWRHKRIDYPVVRPEIISTGVHPVVSAPSVPFRRSPCGAHPSLHLLDCTGIARQQPCIDRVHDRAHERYSSLRVLPEPSGKRLAATWGPRTTSATAPVGESPHRNR